MKLSEYIKYLVELEKQGYGEFPIIYSSDDEGNSYQKVYSEPQLFSVENIEDYYLEYTEDSDFNCVIIN